MSSFPLTRAVRAHDLAAVVSRLRQDGGAPDLERDDDQGFTPLSWAARDGQLEIVAALLACGADPASADVDGHTPLDLARRAGHPEVVSLLEAILAPPPRVGRRGAPPAPRAPLEDPPGDEEQGEDGDEEEAPPQARARSFTAEIRFRPPLQFLVEVPPEHAEGLQGLVKVELQGRRLGLRWVKPSGDRVEVQLLARDLTDGLNAGSQVRVAITPTR